MSNNFKTAVITGGTSGLGEAAAFALAKAGWQVHIVGRDLNRAKNVMSKAGSNIRFYQADLFSLADVTRLADTLLVAVPKLDLLINNAGGTFREKIFTIDGLERTFALNVATPFTLAQALLPSLVGAKGRVLNITTGVPKNATVTLDQLNGSKASSGMQSYIRNKLALIAVTQEQAKRYAAFGVTSVALHPGIIPGTRFGGELPKAMLAVGGFMTKLLGLATTLDQAAERFVTIGTGHVKSGGYYKEGKLSLAPASIDDPAFTRSLWMMLESLVAPIRSA
jgi:NAD(P)-dependent dehydrogenase (short-subunit alcohol dehydrogenase family)